MEGKPPPKRAARGPHSSPAGTAPQPSQGPHRAGPWGGLMGIGPPAGADSKRRGRGGEGARLSDVRWGMIFKLGWKLLSYFKFLAIGYCLMMLVQNCVNLGTSQLLGEVTKALNSSVRAPAPAAETAAAPNTTAVSPANANAPVAPPANPRSRLFLMSILWAAFALAALAIGLPMRAISTKLDMALSNKLRSQLFARMLRQSPEFYHVHESGELNAVVNQFTVEASMTLRQVSVDMVVQVVTLGITVGLLIYNFQMDGPPPTIFGVAIPPAAIPLAIVLFAFISPWVTGRLSNKVRDVSRDLQEKMVALNSLVTGAMQSPEEIQAMEAEPMFVAKHDKQLRSLLASRVKNTVTMESMGLISSLPGWFVQVVMLAFGIFAAYKSGNPAAAGNVVAIFLLTPQLMGPIQALSVYIIMAGRARPRIENVHKIIESRALREEKSGTLKVASVEPTLAAKNLTFSYKPGTRQIFDDISFEIPPGKITGFVARMGQGKTTFFKLALRFYDPQKGAVILGGRPVGDYSSDNLYNHIAMMSQFPAFFYDTLRANMQMAKADATDEEIRAICEKTGVWKILQAGVQGNPLDQEFAAARRVFRGQKEAARAPRFLVRHPPGLLLHQPPSGDEYAGKHVLREVLKNALKGHTVMVVDHDLRWLMPFCDYFVVLDDGKIAEQGTSEELLARRGLFHELYHAEDSKPEAAEDAHAGPPPPQMAGMSGMARQAGGG